MKVPASESPFERYDLDPREGVAAITQRLKELAAEAKDDAERDQIRAAWEELTLHPGRRLRAALFAHPETRAPLGASPPLARRRPRAPVEPGLRELAQRPSVLLATLAPSETGLSDPRAGAAGAHTEPLSLEDDPVLEDAAL